ncbi:MAG: hypothetical protein PHX08_01290 [Lachnospiraceae bacterium]|nr:hypothetical protein [Lachnospiraceae bacterium]
MKNNKRILVCWIAVIVVFNMLSWCLSVELFSGHFIVGYIVSHIGYCTIAFSINKLCFDSNGKMKVTGWSLFVLNIFYAILQTSVGILLCIIPNMYFRFCLIIEVIIWTVYIIYSVILLGHKEQMINQKYEDDFFRTTNTMIDYILNFNKYSSYIDMLYGIQRYLKYMNPLSTEDSKEIEKKILNLLSDISNEQAVLEHDRLVEIQNLLEEREKITSTFK